MEPSGRVLLGTEDTDVVDVTRPMPEVRKKDEFEDIEPEFLVTDKSLIKIPIYESPLYLCKVIKKGVPIPIETRNRHLYSGLST